MCYLVPGPPPCPEVVAISYIRQAEVPTLFSVEGEAQVERQNTVVGFLTPCRTTPHPLGSHLYVHNDLRLLTSQYPGRNWVNNALIDEGDEGLCAEALHYRRMMDEMTDKEAELNVIQDRIAVLTLDLWAAMQRLSCAEAVTRIEDQRTTAASQRALSAWVVEQGRST